MNMARTFIVTLSFLGMLACRERQDSSRVLVDTDFQSGAVDLTIYKVSNKESAALNKKFEGEVKQYALTYDGIVKEVQKKLPKAPKKIRDLVDQNELQNHELAAIFVYTTNAYQFINGPLRKSDKAALGKWEATIKLAASGLNKFPSFSCKAKRGTDLPSHILSSLVPQHQFEERAFFSTTSGKIPKAFVKSVEMAIDSDDCKDVSWISKYPNEKEVLFPPGSEFVVTSRESCVAGPRQVCLKLQHTTTSNSATTLLETSGEEASRGTLGMERSYLEKEFTQRKYLSEQDGKKHIYFQSTKKGIWRNTSGDNEIHDWVLDDDSNVIEIHYSRLGETARKKAYFYVMSENEVGYMKGPSSDVIQEYYRFQ